MLALDVISRRARPSRRQRPKARMQRAICGLTRALIRTVDERGKGEPIPCRTSIERDAKGKARKEVIVVVRARRRRQRRERTRWPSSLVLVEQDAEARRGVVVFSGVVVVVRVKGAKRLGGFYTTQRAAWFICFAAHNEIPVSHADTIIGGATSSGTLWKMLFLVRKHSYC